MEKIIQIRIQKYKKIIIFIIYHIDIFTYIKEHTTYLNKGRISSMEELCDKIKKYKQGDIKALEEILIQMTPLVKKLCRKDSFHGI